ncbi:hypothetical protein SDC9_107964 [bioreactor metagenome]|uniref:Uncharacterized protein n=1 Tax=bioreactor metagenome TaxID=1076179 RepID=A0A645B6Q0_9ZZZZ
MKRRDPQFLRQPVLQLLIEVCRLVVPPVLLIELHQEHDHLFIQSVPAQILQAQPLRLSQITLFLRLRRAGGKIVQGPGRHLLPHLINPGVEVGGVLHRKAPQELLRVRSPLRPAPVEVRDQFPRRIQPHLRFRNGQNQVRPQHFAQSIDRMAQIFVTHLFGAVLPQEVNQLLPCGGLPADQIVEQRVHPFEGKGHLFPFKLHAGYLKQLYFDLGHWPFPSFFRKRFFLHYTRLRRSAPDLFVLLLLR